MLLGLISLLLGQWARSISQICVNSSLFTSQFFICSVEDFGTTEHAALLRESSSDNDTIIPRGINYVPNHQCGMVTLPSLSLFASSCFFHFGRLIYWNWLNNCRAVSHSYLMKDLSSFTVFSLFLVSHMCYIVVWL